MIAAESRSNAANDVLRWLTFAREVLLRRRRLVLTIFGTVMAVVVVGILLLRKEYRSEAKLLVRIGRESITLDPTVTTGRTLSVYDSRETEINSIVEVVSSRAVLEDVVDRLGADAILGRSAPQERSAATEPVDEDAAPAVARSGWMPSLGKSFAVTDREKAVRELQETIGVHKPRKSNVVSVTCTAHSPELAQEILQALLDAFRLRHLAAHRTDGSYEFFVEQERLLSEQLEDASKKLGAARNELGLATIETRRKTLTGQLAEIDSQRMANRAAIAASTARVESLQARLGELPDRMVAQEVTGFAEDAAGRTQAELATLRLRRERLLSNFTEHHPDVVALTEQIARTEDQLSQQAEKTTQTTRASNPTWQQLHSSMLTEQANLSSLRGREATLDAQHDELFGELRRLNDHEGQLLQLENEVALLRTKHQEYAEKLEQARIDRALAAERISNVNVVQPPTFVAKAVGPKRRLIGFLGLFVAAVGAVGTAFVLEFFAPPPASRPGTPLRTELALAASR